MTGPRGITSGPHGEDHTLLEILGFVLHTGIVENLDRLIWEAVIYILHATVS